MRLLTMIGFLFTVIASFVGGCSADTRAELPHATQASVLSGAIDRDAYHITVDCLLPGQLRSLGQSTYLSPSRAVRVSAAECEIRGGKYARPESAVSRKTWKSNTDNRIDEEQLYGGMH